MLVEFKFSNFRSFKEEVIFSMEPTTSNKKNINTIQTNLKKIPELYRSSGIFGANASGKSNTLKAFAFFKYLIKNSAKFLLEDKIPQEQYALSSKTEHQPMCFSIKFITNETLFEYSVAILNNSIQSESLYYTPISTTGSAQKNRIFEKNNINGSIQFKKSTGIPQSWINETLDNRLFLSEIVNNRKCTINNILNAYNWLTTKLIIADSKKLSGIFSLKQILNGNGENIIQLIKNTDLGIEDITVKEVDIDEALKTTPDNSKKMLELISQISHGKAKTLQAKSIHKTEDGQFKEFDFQKTESDGTNRLLSLSGPIWTALQNGEILIFDELDMALHPLLIKHLLSLFNNSEINQRNAQIIFASHAHYLMDSIHLSSDQIWFVSKELNNGFYSDLYSLSDFKLTKKQKNISFYDAYINGIYGAVPFIKKEKYGTDSK
ncbi:MAG: ATP-binding protein [Alphaproteobacteria bacterium]|nr:ATP-binding protein [Alphaproteobacteria bacterium]